MPCRLRMAGHRRVALPPRLQLYPDHARANGREPDQGARSRAARSPRPPRAATARSEGRSGLHGESGRDDRKQLESGTTTLGRVVQFTATFTNAAHSRTPGPTIATDATSVFDCAVRNGDQPTTSGRWW